MAKVSAFTRIDGGLSTKFEGGSRPGIGAGSRHIGFCDHEHANR